MAAIATPPPVAPASTVPTPVAPPTPVVAPTPVRPPLAAPDNRSLAELVNDSIVPAPDTPGEIVSPETPVDPLAASVAPVIPVTDPAEPTIDPLAVAPGDDLDFTEGVDPNSVSEDGKRHFYDVKRSLKLQQAAKFVNGLQELMPVVSLDAVKERIERANASDRFMNMYQQAGENPEALNDFLGVLYRDANGNVDPMGADSFGRMAVATMTQLPQVNPQAAQYLQNFFRQQNVQALYQRALQMTDGPDRNTAIALAQQADKAFTGKFIKAEQLLRQGVVDPQDRLAQENQQLRQELQNRDQHQRQTASQGWSQRMDTEQGAAIQNEIASALAPIRANFEKTEYWPQMQQELRLAIAQAEQSHPEWGLQFGNLTDAAKRIGAEQSLKALADFRASIARRVVRQNLPTLVARYTPLVTAASQAAQARASQQPPSEPAPNGAAAPASNGAIEQAAKATSWNDTFKALGFATR